MRVGGPARFFAEVRTEDELRDTLLFAKQNQIPILVIGEGSNIVVSDQGFNGLVITLKQKRISFRDFPREETLVVAEAGERWDDLVSETIEKKLYGLENLSAIPGTVGAAPVQNIGAYGVEIGEMLSWVKVFDTQKMQTAVLTNDECRFGYRDSIFKYPEKNHLIILQVGILLHRNQNLRTDYKDIANYVSLRKAENLTVRDMRDIIISIRKSKFPDPKTVGTVGSFFKNPIISRSEFQELSLRIPGIPGISVGENNFKIPLAWVIERVCGLKGVRRGLVGVSERQALVLVNYGRRNAREIRSFAEEIAECVKEKTGIEVTPEVSFVGEF